MVNSLSETVEMMISSDYKERFKAEYYQLAYRYDKLKQMYDNWDTLDFTPTCSREIYQEQLSAMENYLIVLEKRAREEEVTL